MRHAEGFTRYGGAAGTEFAHEAGFDAFMTGSAYAGLLCLTQAAEALPAQPEAPTYTNAVAGSGEATPPAAEPQPQAVQVWAHSMHTLPFWLA